MSRTEIHWKYEYTWAAHDRLSEAGKDGWRVVGLPPRQLDGKHVYLMERIAEDLIPEDCQPHA